MAAAAVAMMNSVNDCVAATGPQHGASEPCLRECATETFHLYTRADWID